MTTNQGQALCFEYIQVLGSFIVLEVRVVPLIYGVMCFCSRNICNMSFRVPLSPFPPPPSLTTTRSRSRSLFLLLVIDELEVVLRDVLVLLEQELLHLIADVALDDDLLASTGDLCNGRSGRELLAEVFGDLLFRNVSRVPFSLNTKL